MFMSEKNAQRYIRGLTQYLTQIQYHNCIEKQQLEKKNRKHHSVRPCMFISENGVWGEN